MTRPRPSQPGQVLERMNWPNTLCETCWTRPAPAHDGQTIGSVPGSAPLPPQRSQSAAARTGTLKVAPANASASEISATR